MFTMRPVLFSIAIAAALSGCAVTSSGGERMALRSDAFSAYVEAVFRYQNDVSTDLAFAIDDESPDSERYAALDALELELLTACRGLNELARAARNGEPVGGFGALKRARAAPECEHATDTAAAVLQRPTP